MSKHWPPALAVCLMLMPVSKVCGYISLETIRCQLNAPTVCSGLPISQRLFVLFDFVYNLNGWMRCIALHAANFANIPQWKKDSSIVYAVIGREQSRDHTLTLQLDMLTTRPLRPAIMTHQGAAPDRWWSLLSTIALLNTSLSWLLC